MYVCFKLLTFICHISGGLKQSDVSGGAPSPPAGKMASHKGLFKNNTKCQHWQMCWMIVLEILSKDYSPACQT